MNKKSNKHYYITYCSNNIIGSCTISSIKKINTYKDIEAIQNYISKEYCNKNNVIILNYIKIKKEQV